MFRFGASAALIPLLASCASTSAPPATGGDGQQKGRLAPEEIQRVVRTRTERYRNCYVQGLGRNRELTGTVVAWFTIDTDGKVASAQTTGDIPDDAVKACVENEIRGLRFPPPVGGVVKVSYPFKFVPARD